MSYAQAQEKGLVVPIDPKEEYFKRIREIVQFDVLKKARLQIVVDLMHGNGSGYLDELFYRTAGVNLKVLHDNRDPFFGGHHPEPGPDDLKEAAQLVKTWPAHLGLANDGDADRFGVIDADGTYISPNEVLAILFDHLLKTRDWKGCVVRTVATTHLIDAIAKAHDVPLKETPVGFKYIAEIMAKEPILIGGEESGGLTVHGHVPEKDGILACLLMAEVVASEGKNLIGGPEGPLPAVRRILLGPAEPHIEGRAERGHDRQIEGSSARGNRRAKRSSRSSARTGTNSSWPTANG